MPLAFMDGNLPADAPRPLHGMRFVVRGVSRNERATATAMIRRLGGGMVVRDTDAQGAVIVGPTQVTATFEAALSRGMVAVDLGWLRQCESTGCMAPPPPMCTLPLIRRDTSAASSRSSSVSDVGAENSAPATSGPKFRVPRLDCNDGFAVPRSPMCGPMPQTPTGGPWGRGSSPGPQMLMLPSHHSQTPRSPFQRSGAPSRTQTPIGTPRNGDDLYDSNSELLRRCLTAPCCGHLDPHALSACIASSVSYPQVTSPHMERGGASSSIRESFANALRQRDNPKCTAVCLQGPAGSGRHALISVAAAETKSVLIHFTGGDAAHCSGVAAVAHALAPAIVVVDADASPESVEIIYVAASRLGPAPIGVVAITTCSIALTIPHVAVVLALPTADERVDYFRAAVPQQKLTSLNWSDFVEVTAGISWADLNTLCRSVGATAVRRFGDSSLSIDDVRLHVRLLPLRG